MHLLFISRMSAQEFILIQKENYNKNQPKASEILDDPTITAKSQQLTLLKRVPEQKEPEKDKTFEEKKAPETREDIQKTVLRSITMLNPNQTEKSKSILKEMRSSSDVSINDEGLIEINNTPITIDASNFLFTLQQPTKKFYHPDYKRILDKIKISPDLVPNSEAKEIVKPKVVKTKFVTTPKTKSSGKTPSRRKDDQQSGPSFESQKDGSMDWETFNY